MSSFKTLKKPDVHVQTNKIKINIHHEKYNMKQRFKIFYKVTDNKLTITIIIID